MSGNEISQIFFIFFFPMLARIRRRSLWTSVAMLLSALGDDDGDDDDADDNDDDGYDNYDD